MHIEITSSAISRIQFLRESNPHARLRIMVEGGGCSGMQYSFTLDPLASDTDRIFQDLVVIDDLSLSFVENSVLDYVEDLSSAKFVLSNPNASSKCGCGNSFSL